MTAAIVETRINYQLHKIIEAHLEFIPDPDLYFFTTSEGYDFYSKRVDAKFVIIHSIGSLHAYNQLLTSYSFWEYLPKGHCLIFQADSMLLRDGIEEFLPYDYIGAPLYHIDFPAMNGGLSLRNVDAMIKCIDSVKWNQSMGNEDIYFCHTLAKIGGKLPLKEVAQKFSVETIFGLGSLGIHAISKYLSPEQCKKIYDQYT